MPRPGNCPALQEEQQNPIRQGLVLPTWTEKKKQQTHKKNKQPYLYILTAISLLLVAATLVGCFLQTPGGRAAV